MAYLIKDRYPLWKRILIMSSKMKRRAFRTFAPYPDRPYQVLVDIGAARGDYTARAAALFPLTRAVLVEAHPCAARDIKERFRGDARFSVAELAISNNCGETIFHVNEMKDSSSILNVNRSTSEAAFGKSFGTLENIVVKTLTLDALYRDENLRAVDLLKVDIQGAEMQLIEGGREALKKTRAVLIEVNFEQFYEGAPMFHEIEENMNANGFRLFALLNLKHDQRGGFLSYANALYLRQIT